VLCKFGGKATTYCKLQTYSTKGTQLQTNQLKQNQVNKNWQTCPSCNALITEPAAPTAGLILYSCVYANTHTFIYIYMNEYLFMNGFLYMSIYIRIYVCLIVYIQMWVCGMCVACVRANACVCVCVCV